MTVLKLIEERDRWDKLSDGELLKEISALLKQFSEVQSKLIEAKKVYAQRKKKTKDEKSIKPRDTGYLFSCFLDQLIFYYTFHSILVLPILAVQFGSCEGTGKQTGSNVAANTSC